MPKTKENKGVTLMTLIITIIVLLILTGVTISNIGGNEDTLRKAKAARDLNDSSNELEDIRIAVIHAEEKSLDGTVNADNLKIALNGVVSQEEINKITGNGPWIVNKNGRDYKIEDDGTVIDYTKVSRINTQIGQTVTYPTLGGATGWKIFYADNEEMFIMSSNIISQSADGFSNGIPLSTKTVAQVMGKGTYGGKWNSTWLNTSGVVTSENRHKAVTYLCDSENWGAYVAKDGTTPKIANSYAVGAPTLELFVASWNKAASTSKRVPMPLETTPYGYYQTISSGITTSEANSLYNPTGIGYYWLASPWQNNSYSQGVRYVNCYSGYTFVDNNYRGYKDIYVAFRPLVSIPINNVDFSGENVIIKDDNGNQIQ